MKFRASVLPRFRDGNSMRFERNLKGELLTEIHVNIQQLEYSAKNKDWTPPLSQAVLKGIIAFLKKNDLESQKGRSELAKKLKLLRVTQYREREVINKWSGFQELIKRRSSKNFRAIP